ncbi:MAG TPA: hypothetical protein VJM12_17750 [Pyrinomonadaceae bacterium]|nr:hypothetical protein [Pyrinomonadaceae bacterium]
MNRQLARLMKHRMRRRAGDTAELAAQLAPLEELDKHAAEQQGAKGYKPADTGQVKGAIVVDTGNLALPKDISEGGDEGWGIEPVVIVIVSVVLAFIGFIAWQISRMPVQ